MHRKRLLARLVLASAILEGVGSACARLAPDQDPFDQSGVALEVLPTDPALAKIVLVAGRLPGFPSADV